jgi:hypothetical protein
MEAVERPRIRDQRRPLVFEHLEDRSLLLLGMRLGLGEGDAAIEQVGIELLVALELEARREEAPAHRSNLVLDLPLLPAGRRSAGRRLDQVVGSPSAGSGG